MIFFNKSLFLITLILLVSFCNKKDILHFKFKKIKIFTEIIHPTNPVIYQCPVALDYIQTVNCGGSVVIPDVCFLTHDSLYILSGRLILHSNGIIQSDHVYVIKNLKPKFYCKELDTTNFYGEIKGQLVRKSLRNPYLNIQLYINNNLYSGLTFKSIKP